MSNSRKTGTTIYISGQAALLGLTLLTFHVPADAQTPGARPIAFGQTVQGTLTSIDPVTDSGTPVDTYIFTATPGQGYLIAVRSPTIPLVSSLFRVVPGGGFSGEQIASVFAPGQAVGYFGVIDQPGRYEVDVQSTNPQQPTGAYTLSLLDLNLNTPLAKAPPAQ